MDDVIAVEVKLDTGELRYLVTWGRIQATVDPKPVADLVLAHSRSFLLGGVAVAARVCGTLRVAAESGVAPYFYECLLGYARTIPLGTEYETWRAERAEAMARGQEIAYCGQPGPGQN